MKKYFIIILSVLFVYSCTNNAYKVEFEKNTEIAKAYLKLHEEENAEAMFEYLHPEMEWHMPVYGMDMGDIEDVKEAIRGYQSEFNNMKFTADYWLPGVNTETGIPDGSTRVYGTWTSTHASTGKETSLTTYHSFEFNEGKIFKGGDWFDLGGMMNSLSPNSLNQGSLMGIHTLKINLKRGATMEQFENYFLNETIPNYEKEFKGAKVNLVKGIRGENKGDMGMIWIFESNEARDLFYDSDGAPTKLNQEVNQRLRTVDEGLSKIGTWTSRYTDWSVY
ncbi:MAG: nuclear transport factor 2 family protein [Flavobacteriaceae bacterium]|nr:nuclear transport factor 2 family protein [Flavobacteriaceae bacterium]